MDAGTYEALLERTAEMYPLHGFEVLAEPELPKSFCILRHDIDMSPAAALQVAEMEAKRGIRSTYMVLLTGPQYSPFEKPTLEQLKRIADLGHEIGLHFDAAWHAIEEEASLEAAVASEAKILRQLLPDVEVRCFSFHNTTEFTMSARNDRYGGLWNAYSGRLQEQAEYVSDSNGYWRFRSWNDLLEMAPDRLQVLTHAEWWTEPGTTPAQKICRIMGRRGRTGWSQYVDLLQGGGRPLGTDIDALENRLLATPEGRDLMMAWLGGEHEAAFLTLVTKLAKSSFPVGVEVQRVAHDLLAGSDVGEQRLREAFEEAAHKWTEHQQRFVPLS